MWLFGEQHVLTAPELFIADENQNPLYERHYEVNSTLEVRNNSIDITRRKMYLNVYLSSHVVILFRSQY